MSIEGVDYFKQFIRQLPGEKVRPTYFETRPRHFANFPIDISFIIIDQGDSGELVPGLYTKVGLIPWVYNQTAGAKNLVNKSVAYSLSVIERERLTTGPETHRLGPVSLEFVEGPGRDLILTVDIELTPNT